MIGKVERCTYYVISGYFGDSCKYWNEKRKYWVNFVEQATKYDYDVLARKKCYQPKKYQPNYFPHNGIEIRKVKRSIETVDEWNG